MQVTTVSKRTCAAYAGDMHALEQHMLEAFERQVAITKEFRDAHVVVLSLVATSKRHAQLLNQHVSSLGDVEKIVTDKLKTAVAGFFGIAAGLVDTVRPLSASKALRDSYTALNHAIVGYVMLSSTASALKSEETKLLADQFLRDYIELAQQVMAVIPSLTVRDISDSGVPVLNFNAAQQFKTDKQWAVLFGGDFTPATTNTSETSLPEALLAPNKIVVERLTSEAISIGHVDKPIIETVIMPVIVEETFRPEKIIEVQPVIHREIRAPEVHHIERHVYEKVEASGSHVVTNKPIIEETIKPVIVEEVQEIIHRELPAPFVEKVEKHITEVEIMPTVHTKEVILEKEEVLQADLVVESVPISPMDAITLEQQFVKAALEATPPVGISAGAPVGLAALPKRT